MCCQNSNRERGLIRAKDDLEDCSGWRSLVGTRHTVSRISTICGTVSSSERSSESLATLSCPRGTPLQSRQLKVRIRRQLSCLDGPCCCTVWILRCWRSGRARKALSRTLGRPRWARREMEPRSNTPNTRSNNRRKRKMSPRSVRAAILAKPINPSTEATAPSPTASSGSTLGNATNRNVTSGTRPIRQS